MNPNALMHFAYDELDGGCLRQHQAEGVALTATTPKTVCADPVGAGKTVPGRRPDRPPGRGARGRPHPPGAVAHHR